MRHHLPSPGFAPTRSGTVSALLVVLAGCTLQPHVTPVAELPVLSGAAQAVRFASVQQALEHQPSGDPLLWTEREAGVQGSVIPIGTVNSRRYGWCRDYEERITTPEHAYHLVGVACRGPGSEWLVLDMRPLGGGPG